MNKLSPAVCARKFYLEFDKIRLQCSQECVRPTRSAAEADTHARSIN